MKTVIKQVEAKMVNFFGEALLEAAQKPSGFINRHTCVKFLKASKESAIANVETRMAYSLIESWATDNQEIGFLRESMGIHSNTARRWKKDTQGILSGELKVRTAIIRTGAVK